MTSYLNGIAAQRSRSRNPLLPKSHLGYNDWIRLKTNYTNIHFPNTHDPRRLHCSRDPQ